MVVQRETAASLSLYNTLAQDGPAEGALQAQDQTKAG